MKTILILSAALSTIFLFSTANAEDDDKAAEHKEMMVEHEANREIMMEKMHHRRQQHMDDRLNELDTNGDGKIDLNEYVSSAEERFTKMDVNEDGFITTEEAREAHKLMREKYRQAHQKHFEARGMKGESEQLNKDSE